MKYLFLTLTLIFLGNQIHAQQQISRSFTTKRIDNKFNINKLYNKKTGKRIKQQEFYKLVKNNPNLPLENVYDKYGEIEKYFYDPNTSSNTIKNRSGNIKPKKGELFPDFSFKTITNEIIELEKLKGKLVILRFELFADNFRFKKDEIVELDTKINESLKKSEIEAILIFTTPKEEILRGFSLKNSNFKLVANGNGFHNKFHINRFPLTIVIDKRGKLIDKYNYIHEIDIKKLADE